MSCRVSTLETIEFRSKLEFRQHDLILCKEFSNEHNVLGYIIDLYFPKHKLAIEGDEKGHTDRDKRKENKKEEKIMEELGCKFIRINPDEKDYDEYVKFGKINDHISESNKNSTEKSTKKSL